MALDPPRGARQLIFPQFANGELQGLRIRSSFLVCNPTPYPAAVTIELWRDDGAPLQVPMEQGGGPRWELSLPPGALLRMASTGAGSFQKGWVLVESNFPLQGMGSYLVETAAGEFLSEAGVPASSLGSRSGVFAEVGGTDPAAGGAPGVDTALAVVNPSDVPLHLELVLLSAAGDELARRQINLDPRRQTARYVRELFPEWTPQSFQGMIWLEADQAFSALALRTHGWFYTSLASASPAVPAASRTLVLPRLGEGRFAGPGSGELVMNSRLVFVNPGDTAGSVRLELFDTEGQPWEIDFGGEEEQGIFPVGPRSVRVLEPAGDSGPGRVGWARVELEGSVTAQVLVGLARAADRGFVSELGVEGVEVGYHPRFWARREGFVAAETAFAFTNPGEESVTLECRLLPIGPADAKPIATRQLDLPPHAHRAYFLRELFPGLFDSPTQSWEGRLLVRAWVTAYGEDVPAPLAPLTLLTRGTRWTTLPAAFQEEGPIPLSSFDAQVDALLAQMTLEEKVGQMTQAERSALNPVDDIRTLGLGSILSGGGSSPTPNEPAAWAAMYDEFQSLALVSRLGIPILYGIDAVHGHNNVVGAVIFPHNIGLGATSDPRLVERVARVTAAEVRATGMQWTFSPVVAVPRDERWGRTYEGFGEDPELVRMLGKAAVRGYQGFTLGDPASIAACAKHYVGDGGTVWGTGQPIDRGDAQMDEATLRRIHLPGYLGALEAGVATIMASFSSWNGVKLSEHRYLLTDVLKEELGFEGLLVSDWAAIEELPGDYRDQVKAGINAGLDMIMVPYRYREFISTLLDLVRAGEVPRGRIDDAVRRILRVKFVLNLFQRSPLTDSRFTARLGSAEHRRLAREAVRRSVVLLKNEGGILPLPRAAEAGGEVPRILVAGRHADNLGFQCGGWTITWQGGSGRITVGTTILEGLREVAGGRAEILHSADAREIPPADLAVVVVGEEPYAEWLGDRPAEELQLSAADRQVIARVEAVGLPYVLVLVTGRPLLLGDLVDRAAAVVVAWLPGTEGAGVADVLFGETKPTGRLPCSWPRSAAQIPINVGDMPYDPLFPYGYGLTYP